MTNSDTAQSRVQVLICPLCLAISLGVVSRSEARLLHPGPGRKLSKLQRLIVGHDLRHGGFHGAGKHFAQTNWQSLEQRGV